MPYKSKTEQSKDKFLGKELEYDKLIFNILESIRLSSANGNIQGYITNIGHLDDSFPYKTKEYTQELERLEKRLKRKLGDSTDRMGKPDHLEQQKAMMEFANGKYRLLCDLLKRKKKFPQEAEEEWL